MELVCGVRRVTMRQMSSLHLGLDTMCMMHVEYSLLRECVGFPNWGEPEQAHQVLRHLHTVKFIIHHSIYVVHLTSTVHIYLTVNHTCILLCVQVL